MAFPYRWSTRAILLDKTDAVRLLTRIRRQWFAKRKSVAAILKEVMTNEHPRWSIPTRRTRRSMPTWRCTSSAPMSPAWPMSSATITVWDRDPRAADEKLRLVEKIVQGGFHGHARPRPSMRSMPGSVPCRGMPTPMFASPDLDLELAHMIPLSAVWAGPDRNDHLDAPPLLFGKTEGSTPFRLSLHIGDVGHTLVIGRRVPGIRASGADRAAVPALCTKPDLRL